MLKIRGDPKAYGHVEGVGVGRHVENGIRGAQQCLAERTAGKLAAHLHRVGFGGLEKRDDAGHLGHDGRGEVVGYLGK